MVLTYEDEFPNFVGVCTYNKDGEDTDNCLEWEELREIMCDNDEELAKLWDEDNEEWTDEDAAYDIMCDIQWDTIHDWQADNIEWSITL